MSRTVCRTCLKRCTKSFKLYDMVGHYRRNNDTTKFSEVLKFIAPELYLGVSRKPDLCYHCVDALVNAYVFRKKCLHTEETISKYLQRSRCTAESIDLLDILTVVEPNDIKEPVNVTTEVAEKPNDQIEANIFPMAQPEMQQKKKEPNDERMFHIDSVYSVSEKTHEDQRPTFTTPVRIKQEKLSPVPETQKPNPFKEFPRFFPSPRKILPKPAAVKIETEEITIKEEVLDPEIDPLADTNNLQGIIDSIDKSCDNEEYDIPEFVQINKIELKHMQPMDNSYQSKIVPLKIATSIGDMLQNSNQNQMPRNILLQSFGNGLPPLVPLAATTLQNENCLPQMAPYPGGFYIASNFPPKTVVSKLSPKTVAPKLSPKTVVPNIPPKTVTPTASTQAMPSPVLATSSKLVQTVPKTTQGIRTGEKRRRGRVKIVPVAEVVTKFEPETVCPPYSGYSPDGSYINDHDYLITPYKKDKASGDRKLKQMQCFICGNTHAESRHAMHMKRHSSICDVCKEDLGTPFMLNLHYKTHSKPCKLCTEKVPYWDIEKHEQQHLEEDEKFVESDVEKTQFGCHRGRRRQTEDEKPVYFAVKMDNNPNFGFKVNCPEDNGLVIRRRGRKKKVVSEPSDELISIPVRKSPRISKPLVKLEELSDAGQSDEGTNT